MIPDDSRVLLRDLLFTETCEEAGPEWRVVSRRLRRRCDGNANLINDIGMIGLLRRSIVEGSRNVFFPVPSYHCRCNKTKES
mmetsp:Transcript_40987/g.63101  ORF Transcript_40987/g.63101 Transcript_40987/m.63101 type:complete len:82 (+) Transcript_40987:730-975(+)